MHDSLLRSDLLNIKGISMQVPELDLETFSLIDNVDHGVILDKSNDAEYRLETLDILFVRCIDGKKTISEIHDELVALLDYEIAYESIWKAFDNLSDIGILKKRLSPPAGGQITSRRNFFRTFGAPVAATTAAMASSASFAQSEQESKLAFESNAKNQAQESVQKAQAEQNGKLAAESQAKSAANELSNKEMNVKAGGGGGTPPVASVPEPQIVSLLGLGVASLALLRLRAGKVTSDEESTEEN